MKTLKIIFAVISVIAGAALLIPLVRFEINLHKNRLELEIAMDNLRKRLAKQASKITE